MSTLANGEEYPSIYQISTLEADVKSTAFAVLGTSLAILVSGCFFSPAQQPPDSPQNKILSCVQWLQTTALPSMPMFNPSEFCSGLKGDRPADGWYTLKCGNTGAGYCETIGLVMPGDSVAISVSTPSKDGHEFLLMSPEKALRDTETNIGATFYSRTDFAIGDLKLKSGIYKLIPYQIRDGWKLAVIESGGEWNGRSAIPAHAGTTAVKAVAPDSAPLDSLQVQLYPYGRHCQGSKLAPEFRELEFSFADTAISVCIKPDQVAPIQEDEVSRR